MQDSLTSDVDADGRAESGDVLTYMIVITNTGTLINGVGFSATPDLNTLIVPGSIRISPMAIDDSYTAFRDTDLVVDASDGVLVNDFDPDGDPLVIAVSDMTSNQGGGVILDASNGSFTYQPPSGFQGTDTFTYALDDGFGGVVSGTVTIEVEGKIWFVDNTAPAGGDGSMPAPFDNLAAAEVASAPGDTIFVYLGDDTDQNLDQGIVLKEDQELIGQGVDLVRSQQILVPSLSPPRISNVSHAVILAQGSVVAGLKISSVSGSGLANQTTSLNGAVIHDVSITQTGEAGIRLTSFAGLTLDDIGIVDSRSDGVSFHDAMGTTTISNIRIRNASGDGFAISDSTGAEIIVSGADINNVTGAGFRIVDSSVEIHQDLPFGISGTGAPAVSIERFSGSYFVTDAVHITGECESGIHLLSSSGTIRFATVNIEVVQLAGISLDDVTGSITFGDVAIGQSDSAGVRMDKVVHSQVQFGHLDIDLARDGIDISKTNNSAVTFASIDIAEATLIGIRIAQTTTSATPLSTFDLGNTNVSVNHGRGVHITNTPSALIAFPELIVSSSNGTGLAVSDGGSLQISDGSISALMASAIEIGPTTIDLTFNSIASHGSPSNGILLEQVTGPFRVTGQTDIKNVTGEGIHIVDSSADVSLNELTIEGTTKSGLSIGSHMGNVNVNNGSIVGTLEAAMRVEGGMPSVSYNGQILNGAGYLLHVSNTMGGDVAMNNGPFNDSLGLGVRIDSCSSDVSVTGASLAQNLNHSIHIDSSSGEYSFPNTMIADSGNSSIRVMDSSGKIDLGSLDIDNTGSHQFGLHITGTIGSVTTTGGTVKTGMGTPIFVDGQGVLTPLSMLIESASCSGAANGIVLFDTTGHFTVAGDGSTPSSGGTFQATVGDAVDLKNASNISLNLMNLVDSGGNGIDGTSVDGFVLRGCELTGAGDAVDEDAVSFDDLSQINLTGVVEIANNRIMGMAHHGINIENSSGSIASLLIQGCTITDNRASGYGGSGVRIRANGNSQIAAAQIRDCSISRLDGAGIIADSGGVSGHIDVIIENNRLTDIDVNAILLSPFGDGTGEFNVTNNPVIAKVHTDDAVAISTTAASASVVFSNNPMVDFDPMVFFGNNALFIRQDGDGDLDLTVEDNQFINSDLEGIFATARDGLGHLNLVLGENIVDTPITPFADGIFVRSQNTNTLCLNLSTADGAGNNNSIGNTAGGYRTSQQDTSIFNLQGFGGGDSAAVETFIELNNTGTAMASGTYGIGVCETP